MTPKEVLKATGHIVGYGFFIILCISVAWEVFNILLEVVQLAAPDEE